MLDARVHCHVAVEFVGKNDLDLVRPHWRPASFTAASAEKTWKMSSPDEVVVSIAPSRTDRTPRKRLRLQDNCAPQARFRAIDQGMPA